jgi:hypothetical protein
MQAGPTGDTRGGVGSGFALASLTRRINAKIGPAMNRRLNIGPWIGRQVRSVFLVTLIPCFFNQALCSACALVSAAVFGRPTGFLFGVDILMTRDIRLAPTGYADKFTNFGAARRARRSIGLREDFDPGTQPIEMVDGETLLEITVAGSRAVGMYRVPPTPTVVSPAPKLVPTSQAIWLRLVDRRALRQNHPRLLVPRIKVSSRLQP